MKKMAYKMIVSLYNRTLSLFNDDELVKTYPIGVGKMLLTTPTGYYKVINKLQNPDGSSGSMSMGLSRPHYRIHGTNEPWTIGQLVPQGCIRMHNKDILELSDRVSIGTTVVIRHV